MRLKRDGTRAQTRFRLSPKRTSPFKSSFQSTAGSRGACISGSNAGYTTFRGTHSICQFPLHFPSRASPCAISFQTHSANTKVVENCHLMSRKLSVFSVIMNQNLWLQYKWDFVQFWVVNHQQKCPSADAVICAGRLVALLKGKVSVNRQMLITKVNEVWAAFICSPPQKKINKTIYPAVLHHQLHKTLWVHLWFQNYKYELLQRVTVPEREVRYAFWYDSPPEFEDLKIHLLGSKLW